MEDYGLADQLELQDVVELSKEPVVGWNSIFSGLRKEEKILEEASTYSYSRKSPIRPLKIHRSVASSLLFSP
jgi:hypothetical protein